MLMVRKCLEYGIKSIYLLHDIAGKNKLKLFSDNGKLITYNKFRKFNSGAARS